MTGKKPSKPWRVTVTGPEVTATSSFTSEAKTFAFVRATLGDDSPADTAKVEQWEDGRWRHFETVTADEIRPAHAASCIPSPEEKTAQIVNQALVDMFLRLGPPTDRDTEK